MDLREIDDVEELADASRLLARVWDSETHDVMPLNIMKALAHSANYVAGAWLDGTLVGASVAWVWGPERPGALHSHITGVDPAAQGRRVGLALKLHQAAWARDRGIGTVTWTFDPLVRRNGRFNLVRLGAVALSYHPDFYGRMPDGVNAGELSDRCFVEWDVSDPAAAPTPTPAPPPTPGPAPGSESPGDGRALVLLEETPDHRPRTEPWPDRWEGRLLCQVPSDALALRRKDPELGREWRLALRSTMGEAMAAGYAATGMTPDGYYVLERRTG